MNSTESGILIDFSDTHPVNALFPMDLTDGGIVIDDSAWHPLNAISPIEMIFVCIVTDSSSIQFMKIQLGMHSSDCGISNDFKKKQSPKAHFPMCLTEDGR